MAPPPEEEQWQRIGSKIYHEKKYFVGLKWWNWSSHIRNTNAFLVKKKIRTYCVCSPGIYRCNECLAEHLVDVEN